MLKWLDKIKPAVLIAFCIIFVLQTNIVRSETDVSYEIVDIAVLLSDNAVNYTISGTSPPIYNVTEMFAPFRVVVDIAGAFYGKNMTTEKAQLQKNNFAALKVSDVKTPPPHMRFEFTLSDSHDYSVEKAGNNLLVKVFQGTAEKQPLATVKPSVRKSLNDIKVVSTPNTTTITMISSSPIENYTVDTIAGGVNKPPRMYIDIDDVAINELISEKHIGTSVDQIRVASRGNGARIVFDSASQKLFKYTVAPTSNGLNVVIDESNQSPNTPALPSVKG